MQKQPKEHNYCKIDLHNKVAYGTWVEDFEAWMSNDDNSLVPNTFWRSTCYLYAKSRLKEKNGSEENLKKLSMQTNEILKKKRLTNFKSTLIIFYKIKRLHKFLLMNYYLHRSRYQKIIRNLSADKIKHLLT